MTDKILLLFDGDIIVYRAGFAAEKRYYFDSRNPPSEGGMEWDSKVEAKANVELEYIEWDRHLEPLENALQNCKSIIKNTVDYISTIYPTHDIEYVTFLSGNDEVPNFRNKIDPEYKANRKPEHKPTYIEEMKDYLIQHHCGYITQGCEADDFFGQAQTDALKNNKLPIVCSIDKDLKQLSGLHFNFVSQLLEEIPEEEARAVFFRQLLEGDRADNIQGITGIGSVKARKYIPAGLHPDGAIATVTGYYRKEFGNEWLKKYNNNCDLLWIWRKIPDTCPFKVEEKTNDKLQTLQE
tara:strand:- start:15752 stop:16636 length:885 start_codon:yes stop_codon:yes gene_type:complete